MNLRTPFQFLRWKEASVLVSIRESNIHVLYLLNFVLNADTTLFVSQKLSPGERTVALYDFRSRFSNQLINVFRSKISSINLYYAPRRSCIVPQRTRVAAESRVETHIVNVVIYVQCAFLT